MTQPTQTDLDTREEWNQLIRVTRELKALAAPVRLKILLQFETQKFHTSVARLAETIDESVATTSLHLMRATEDGLLDRPNRGQFVLTEKGKWWLKVIRERERLF